MNGCWEDRDRNWILDASDSVSSSLGGEFTARLTGYSRDAVSLAMTSDGKRLVFGGKVNVIRLWDRPIAPFPNGCAGRFKKRR
jgi:WD40 repeat protein